MPRPNTGPRLVGPKRSKGSKEAVYFIRWYDRGSKRERSTGTGQLQAATRELQKEIDRQDAASRTGPRRPHELTIIAAVKRYLEERGPDLHDLARATYAGAALVRWWGDRTISEVKGGTCKLYARERGVSAGTVRRELEVLRSAIVYNFKEGHLTELVGVTLPEKPAAKKRWLTRKEAAALIRAARNEPKARRHLPLFMLIGLYTGQRREAILALQWLENTAGGHVDLEAERIDFNAAGRKQTKKTRPEIRIPSRLLRFLRADRKRTRQYVLEYDQARVVKLRRSFATACKAAGLKNVTPHTLRHTCATWMAQRAVPVFEAAGFLGMTPETFQNTYAKQHPDYQEKAVKAFDKRC